MILMKRAYILSMWKQTTITDGQWFKIYQHRFLWKEAGDFTPEKIDELVKKYRRGYLVEVDVEYLKELHENHNELSFLAERMKIGREEKLVPNLKDKKGCVVHIKN